MTEPLPKVSAVITTYNRKHRLIDAIESVINQTYDNIEIIVIDDNSDYDIKSHLSNFIEETNILKNKQNRGANWSRARGICEAEGELIAFLDDDDIWYPNKIERQVELIKNSPPSVGLVTTGMDLRSGGEIMPREIDGKEGIQSLLKGDNYIGGFSNILVKKEYIKKSGLPDIHLSCSQDLEWYIRLLQFCELKVLNEYTVKYGDDYDDRITKNKNIESDRAFKYIMDTHYELIQSYGVNLLRKVKAKRQYQLASYYAAQREFKKCRTHSFEAIKCYPIYLAPYLSLVIGLTGNIGYDLASSLPAKIRRKLT